MSRPRRRHPTRQRPTPEPEEPTAGTDDDTDQTAAVTGQQSGVAGAPVGSVEQATQLGMPIFDEDHDDVSWLVARSTPPPPPPPFEEVPERPLFAPEPEEGQPARRARPNTVPPGSRDYWPWDTGTGTGTTPVPEDEEDDEVPGRSWLRLAFAIGASLVLLLAVVVAFNLGRGRTPLGSKPEATPSQSPSASAAIAPITGLAARDFDPQGDPPEEHRELAPLAVDGDPSTAWRTMTYDQNMGPGGLKTGVGLTIDLGGVHDVSVVDLTLVGAPTGVSLYVTGKSPRAVSGLTPAAKVDAAGAHQRITLDKPATGRFLTVWLTSLPQAEGGYRGEVAEVAVRG